MKSDIKKFLRRMVEENGYIAQGVYSDDLHFWYSDIKKSAGMIDIVMFHRLRGAGYIRQDKSGRYYPTKKGRRFAMPWYKRIFEVI